MKFGLILDIGKKEAVDLSTEIEDILISRGHEVVRDEDKLGQVEIAIVLGGDGTLLHTACSHIELSIPFVGINVGRLGFLTAAEAIDWHHAVEKLLKGEYEVSERMTLDISIDEDKRKIYRALNDAVVKAAFRVVDLEVKLKSQKFLTIAGDGVIVATQTGSTAYSLSAGGPIVDPDLDCLVITPINAHGLQIPSVVVGPNDEVNIHIEKGTDVSLIVDGQEHTKVSAGQDIKVARGKHRVKFIYFDEHQFLKSLNAKFGLAARLIR